MKDKNKNRVDKKSINGTTQVIGYLLPEEQFHHLQQIRDQILLMGVLTIAVTEEEEEKAPLELRRSMLGQCFEAFGLQLDDVLYAVEKAGQVSKTLSSTH